MQQKKGRETELEYHHLRKGDQRQSRRSQTRGTTMHRAFLMAAACAAALTTLAGGPATASGTYKYWDGTGEVTAFGCPNTTTYGQVITVPATKHFLNKFVFSFVNLNSGSIVLRGEVYAWDGQE